MKDYVQSNRAAYDEVAHEYLERVGNSTQPLTDLAGKPLAIAKQSFKKITALEIGPGSGEVCAYLAEWGCKTIAIDISPKILENVKNISPKTELLEGDVLTYEFGQDQFELIYAGALIHLFPLDDAKLLMKKIYEALKPGGVLFINTTIHAESSEGYIEKHDYDTKVKRFRHRYTELEFNELVNNVGLKVVDQITTKEHDRAKFWLALICTK